MPCSSVTLGHILLSGPGIRSRGPLFSRFETPRGRADQGQITAKLDLVPAIPAIPVYYIWLEKH